MSSYKTSTIRTATLRAWKTPARGPKVSRETARVLEQLEDARQRTGPALERPKVNVIVPRMGGKQRVRLQVVQVLAKDGGHNMERVLGEQVGTVLGHLAPDLAHGARGDLPAKLLRHLLGRGALSQPKPDQRVAHEAARRVEVALARRTPAL
jgi:hypothetical protein